MIDLVEYEPTTLELEEVDLNHLLDLVKASGDDEEAKLIESLTPTRARGVYEVRTGPFVGRLGLPGGGCLNLASRFDFADVIELIRRAARLPIRHDALRVPTDPADTLIDVVATALAREVERIIGTGLAKGYTARRYERPPYPGKLDVEQHLGRFGARPDRLVTVASRLTRDIPVNQALLAALEVLRRVPLSAGPAGRVARVFPAFREVRLTPVAGDDVARLGLSLLTARYADALALAEIVLRSQSLAPRLATKIGASVVFSMPKIWEGYVAQQVRAAWADHFEVIDGYTFGLTAGGSLPAEADVVVKDSGEVIAVYDAKYKWLDKAPSRGDVYQMVTYCERLGLAEATLVYPGKPARRHVQVGARRITVVGLPGPGEEAPVGLVGPPAVRDYEIAVAS
jgi:5-methylcytosine-specific restriction endonuclease McrBC regulatory subunit McrC